MAKIVFYGEDKDNWVAFYTEDNEIYGIFLPKKEWQTFWSFKQFIKKCEDAPIEPEELIGIKIIAIEKVI
jgi:hypothetical protein